MRKSNFYEKIKQILVLSKSYRHDLEIVNLYIILVLLLKIKKIKKFAIRIE
jgi:hypothetical protein